MRRLLTPRFVLSAWLLFVGLAPLACSDTAPKVLALSQMAAPASSALWTNGDFEADPNGATPPSNWTLSYSINSGINGTPLVAPRTFSALNANTQGAAIAATSTLVGPAASQTDPDLGAAQSFRFPKYGSHAARINYSSASANGKNKNTNTLRQSMVLSADDVDLTDGQLHVRMAVAPVLEVPAHNFVQQPYYYIEVLNLTRGTSLYSSFNVAGQSGVPWKTTTSIATKNPTQWLDWQLVDVSPGPLAWAIGDSIQLSAVASGCALGGHFGRLYLDGVAPTIQGLYVNAHGPQTASPNTLVTYTLNYGNGGAAGALASYISFTTPPQTTFVSTTAAGCTAPPAGAAGSLWCPIGTLSPNATGSLQVSVRLSSAASGVITQGSYGINNAAGSGLLGMPTSLVVASPATNLTDIVVTAGATSVVGNLNDTVTFQFVVKNLGPQALSAGTLSVTDTPPPSLRNVSWTCSLTSGNPNTSQCGLAQGTGQIQARPTLAVGGALTYTIQATVGPSAAANNNPPVHAFVASVLGTQADSDTSNNQASTFIIQGSPNVLQLSKSGAANLGTLSALPGGVLCDTNCTSTQQILANSSQVRLLAAPSGGNSFVGWSGACSGTAAVCTLPVAGNMNVVARFAPAPIAGTAASIVAVLGQNQYAALGQTYQTPLSVYVGDANGLPVANANVTFAAPASGASASLSPASAVTNAWGFAQSIATASGAVGAVTLNAQAANVQTPASFTLTNVGSPNNLVAILGTAQSTATSSLFPTPLLVLVRDVNNNAVPGAAVSFAAPASSATASLSANTATTGPDGYASIVATANPNTGSYTVTGAASGAAATANFTLTNNTATPAAIYVVSGAGQTTSVQAAFDLPLTAVVADSLGNALSLVPVTFSAPATAASASLTQSSAATGPTGLAQASAVANAAPGSYLVTATAAQTGLNANFLLTNNGPQYLLVDGGAWQAASVNTAFAQPISVLVTDKTNAPIAGLAVSFVAVAQSPNVILSTGNANTDSSGHAIMPVTAGLQAGLAGVWINTSQATAPVLLQLTNLPGPAAVMQIAAGNNQQQSVLGNYNTLLSVSVTDAYNNLVSGEPVQFTEPSSGPSGSLVVYQLTTDANGQVAVSAQAGTQQGNYSVAASDVARPGVNTTFNLQTTPGPAAFIVAQSGSGQSSVVHTGFAGAISVQVSDLYHNVIAGQQVNFSAPTSGASVSAPTSSVVTDANGLASLPVVANNVAGSYTLSAAVANVGPVLFSLSNLPGTPASISVVGGSNQNATVAKSYATPVVLQLVDAYGNPVPQTTMSLQPMSTPTGAQVILGKGPYVTDNMGQLSVMATANTVAGNTNTVCSTGFGASLVQTSFALQNLAGPLAHLTAVSGAPQKIAANANFVLPLVVGATDSFGNAVAGVGLQFSSPAACPNVTLSATSLSTDLLGQAQITVQAGTKVGSVVVVANANAPDGGPTPARFVLNITAGPAAALHYVSGTQQSVAIDTGLAAPLVVAAVDAYNNPAPQTSVNFLAPSQAASLSLNASSAVTNSQGLAGIGGIANHIPGSYLVQASLAGISADANFNLTNVPAGAPQLLLVSGDLQQATAGTMFNQPLVLRVEDAAGNAVQGAHVRFIVQSPNAPVTLSTASTQSDATGLVQVYATAQSSIGGAVVLASLDSNVQVSLQAFVTPSAVCKLVVDPQSQTQATALGTSFSAGLGVHAQDVLGNPVANQTLVWSLPQTAATATLNSASAVTDASGYASVTAWANMTAGTYTATVTTADNAVQAAYLLRNLPAAPYHLTPVASVPVATDVATEFASPLQVQLVDNVGNPVPHANIVFTAPPAGTPTSVLSNSLVQTDAAGLAWVRATASAQAGSYVVTAAYVGAAAPVVFALTNRPLGFDHFVLAPQTTPQATVINQAFAQSLQAQALDIYNNPVANLAVQFVALTADANTNALASVVLKTTQAQTDAHGVVKTDAVANGVVGACTVRLAVATNANQNISYALQNLAAAPLSLSALGQTAQSAQVQTSFAAPLRVLVTDALATPQAGVAVSFVTPQQANAAGAQLQGNTISDANGVVQLSAYANNVAGSYNVVASVGQASLPIRFGMRNLPAATPSAASATVEPLASPQRAASGQPFLAPLSLIVRDVFGNPVAGVAVTFVVPASSPSVVSSSLSATTDAQGRAQIQGIADLGQGSYVVTANVASLGQSVVFELVNSPQAPPVLSLATGDGQSTTAGASFALPVSFVIRAADGTAQAGLPVTLSSSPAGLYLAHSALSTDANGYVATSVATSSVPGTYLVVASSSHVALSAVARLEVQAVNTTLQLEVAQSPLPIGAMTTLVATAHAASGTPTGVVYFAIDGNVVGQSPVDAAGRAALPTPQTLASGQHEVTAYLHASGAYAGSEAPPQTLQIDGYVMSGDGGCNQNRPGEQHAASCGLLAAACTGLVLRRCRRRQVR